MSKKLDKTLVDAINAAIIKVGSQAELPRQANMSQGNLTKYISGGIHSITEQTYHKLKPFLDLPEANGTKAKPRNPLLDPLVNMFDQLNSEKQHEVLRQAELMLRQAQDTDISLTDDELLKLSEYRINCRYGTDFSFSTTGLCWLYNALFSYKGEDRIFSQSLLRNLLNCDISQSQFRELYICAFPLETYNTREYYQYAFYLNGSPPKYYTSGFDKTYRITDHFEFYNDLNPPFEVPNDSIVEVCFTPQEVAVLKSGKTLKIKFTK